MDVLIEECIKDFNIYDYKLNSIIAEKERTSKKIGKSNESVINLITIHISSKLKELRKIIYHKIRRKMDRENFKKVFFKVCDEHFSLHYGNYINDILLNPCSNGNCLECNIKDDIDTVFKKCLSHHEGNIKIMFQNFFSNVLLEL